MANPIFSLADPLPRGPHGLSREQVAESQRARLLAAITRLVAERGFAALTIGEIAGEASVSRGAFYEHFDGKEDCLLAAYDLFASTLIGAMTLHVDDMTPWEEFIVTTLDGYLGTLEDDPVAARAFMVELDAAGERARTRRREAMQGFAALLASRHAEMRAQNPRLGALPPRAYLAIVLGVRELVREALETDPAPHLRELGPDVLTWLTAMVEGA